MTTTGWVKSCSRRHSTISMNAKKNILSLRFFQGKNASRSCRRNRYQPSASEPIGKKEFSTASKAQNVSSIFQGKPPRNHGNSGRFSIIGASNPQSIRYIVHTALPAIPRHFVLCKAPHTTVSMSSSDWFP